MSLFKLLQQNTTGWVAYKQQPFISHSCKGWEIQGQCASRFSIWWEPASWLIDSCSLDVLLQGKSGKGALQVSYIRGPILFLRIPFSRPDHPKSQLQNFNMWIWGKGDTDFQPIAEQMWIEKRRELRMESRKLHILSSILEKKPKPGAGRRILRGRRVIREVS